MQLSWGFILNKLDKMNSCNLKEGKEKKKKKGEQDRELKACEKMFLRLFMADWANLLWNGQQTIFR